MVKVVVDEGFSFWFFIPPRSLLGRVFLVPVNLFVWVFFVSVFVGLILFMFLIIFWVWFGVYFIGRSVWEYF